MSTKRPQVAVVIGTRPTTTTYRTQNGDPQECQPIPETWPIFNAPRPLYGQITWQKASPNFRSFGWFFAACDPSDEWSQGPRGYISENAMLDARELIFITEDEAVDRAVIYYRDMDGLDVDLTEVQDNPRYRGALIDKGRELIERDVNRA